MLRLKQLYILLLPVMLLCGCSRTFAPDGWLPSTDDYPSNLYGGWITLVASDTNTANEGLYEYKGEFLAVGNEYVYVLADSVYVVRKDNIRNALVELVEKNTSGFTLWGLAFILTPAVNGILSIITAPIGLIAGIAASTTESSRDRYDADYPDDKFRNDVRKFSGFPQRIPGGIELSQDKT